MPKVKRGAEGTFEVAPWRATGRSKLMNSEEATEVIKRAIKPKKQPLSAFTGPAATYQHKAGRQKSTDSEGQSRHKKQKESGAESTSDTAELPDLLAGVVTNPAFQNYVACLNVDDDEGPEQAVANLTRHGQGLIVFLPNGSLRGHAKDSEDGTQLSFKGCEVRSERECTRDADWRLLRLSLSEAGRTVMMLAGKSGGDAAKIRAPLELHGSELLDFRNHLSGCSTSGRFWFDCDLLYDGEEADRVVLQSQGLDLVSDKGGIVNSGKFVWTIAGEQGPLKPLLKTEMPYDSDLDG